MNELKLPSVQIKREKHKKTVAKIIFLQAQNFFQKKKKKKIPKSLKNDK